MNSWKVWIKELRRSEICTFSFMVKKSTKAEFVAKAREVHGNKYSYDEFEYVNAFTKGKIICSKHGEFFQSANSHLKGHGCPQCFRENFKKIGKLTFDVFKKRAEEKHNGKYAYTQTEINNGHSKIKIICPIHGEFEQSAALHLTGQGCPKCGCEEKRKKMANTLEHFISAARKVHEDKYDYSKVEYVNESTKVCIVCPTHGEFWQRPIDHVIGKKGCQKCVGRGFTLRDFEKLAREVHGDKYDYLEYFKSDIKMKIRCRTCGHEFMQKGWSHLQGHGCPYCNSSRLETEVRLLFERNSIECNEQKTFEWLKNTSNLYLDFYLPNYNLAIECQGSQHFPNSRNFGGEDKYTIINFRDKLKKKLCDEHGIELVYFTHEKVEEPYLGKVFNNINDLIEYINSKE